MPILAILDEQRPTLATVYALAQHGLMRPASGDTILRAILAMVTRSEMTVRDILETKPRPGFAGR